MRIVDKDESIAFEELKELLDPSIYQAVIVKLYRSGGSRIHFLKQRTGETIWEWTPLHFGPSAIAFSATDKDELMTSLQKEAQLGYELHYFRDEKEFAAWLCENLREVFGCGA